MRDVGPRVGVARLLGEIPGVDHVTDSAVIACQYDPKTVHLRSGRAEVERFLDLAEHLGRQQDIAGRVHHAALEAELTGDAGHHLHQSADPLLETSIGLNRDSL